MAQKSYLDLKKEVWDQKKCSGCGACIAVCPADAIMFTPGEMVTAPASTGYCKQATDSVPCGACYAVCPRTEMQPESGIGQYSSAVSAQAAFDIPRRQSGGAVTAILSSALDAGLIDAVITVTEDRFTLRPSSAIITNSGVLINQAGSRYSWHVPLLMALKTAVIEYKFRNIAIVGVPCAVQAVARIRSSDNDLVQPFAKSIRLVIGLFCTESFDYSALVEGKLRKDYHLESHDIRKLDVRGKLEIEKEDGSRVSVPLAELEACVRTGCHTCTDLTAASADISAGAVGSPAGMTTLLIRTPVGRTFVDRAVRNNMLHVTSSVDLGAVEKLAVFKRAKNSRK